MDIISISFAIFLIKLAMAVVPIAIGIRLFALSNEKKTDLKLFIARNLLGDEQLIKLSVFNIWLITFASSSVLFGIIIAILFFL